MKTEPIPAPTSVFREVFTTEFRNEVEAFVEETVNDKIHSKYKVEVAEMNLTSGYLRKVRDEVEELKAEVRSILRRVEEAVETMVPKQEVREPNGPGILDVDYSLLAQPLVFDWDLLRLVVMTKLNSLDPELGHKELIARKIGVPCFSAWVRGSQATLSVEYMLRVCAWLGDSPFEYCRDQEDVDDDAADK